MKKRTNHAQVLLFCFFRSPYKLEFTLAFFVCVQKTNSFFHNIKDYTLE